MQTNYTSAVTYFVGNQYLVTDGVVTKYYYAGSQCIAMRKNGTLNYIIGDHLGSTSLVTDAAGVIVSQQQYKAWGETRSASGSEVTKYQYTGQYSDSDFGLMFYNARWYDSSLGRFTSADTVVPGGLQGYDRYAYVKNNPLRYTDPSGHAWQCTGANNDHCYNDSTPVYGITFSDTITDAQKITVYRAADLAGRKFAQIIGGSPEEAFRKAHGNNITINMGEGLGPVDLDTGKPNGNCQNVESAISCHGEMTLANTLHELGHAFENYQKQQAHGRIASNLDFYQTTDETWIDNVGGEKGYWSRTTLGFICETSRCLEHPHKKGESLVDGYAMVEQFGDLYMNWIMDGAGDPNHGFRTDLAGDARRTYMNDEQIPWALGR